MNRETQAKLREITAKLSEILEQDTDEQVMVFTDDKTLKELCGQINLLLLDRQKMKADFRKQEIASKKMLANISHDIKTPLTVILGYLEIMRLRNSEDEALQKVETKAKQVMELTDQFFTLAKLESGDKNIEMVQVNINELCRENVLGYYELLVQKDYAVDIIIPEQHIFVQGNRSPSAESWAIFCQMPYGTAAMENISGFFCGRSWILSVSMWWTRERG